MARFKPEILAKLWKYDGTNACNEYQNEAGFLNSANFDLWENTAIQEVTQRTYLSQWDSVSGIIEGGSKTLLAESYVETANPSTANWATDYYSQYYYETNSDKFFPLDLKQLDNMYNNAKANGWTSASGDNYYCGTPTAEAVAQSAGA